MKKKERRSSWLLPAAIGGLLLIILGASAAFVFRGKGSNPFGPGNGESSRARAVAAARAGRPGNDSWTVPGGLQAASPDTWKVKPDPAHPADGLQSIVQAPLAGTILFGAPESGVAANVYTNRNGDGSVQWARLDLRQPGETTPVNIRPDKTPAYLSACALSPSGEQLVLGSEPNAVKETQLTFFTRDGKSTQTIHYQSDPGPGKFGHTWLRFASEDVLLMWRDGRFIGFDRNKAEESFSTEAPFVGPPELSPGRKWIVGFTGKRFEFYSTADGAPAGGFGIPDGWYEGAAPRGAPKSEAGLAAEVSVIAMSFSPDGERLATCIPGPKGSYLVVVWSLERGDVSESFVMPFRDTQTHLLGPWVWCSPRHLATRDGVLIDLDLKTFVIKYATQNALASVGNPLDGRLWQFGGVPRDKIAAARAKAGIMNEKSRGHFVMATTLPAQKERASLAVAKGGFLFLPGAAVRVESNGEGPQAHHNQMVEQMAEALAARGTPIDPQAKVVVRIEQGPIRKDRITGDLVKSLGPNYALFKIVDGLLTKTVVAAVSPEGQQLFPLSGIGAEFAVAQAEPDAEDVLYQRVRAGIATCKLPRLVARDSRGEPIVLGHDRADVGTTAAPLGVDGLFEAVERPKH